MDRLYMFSQFFLCGFEVYLLIDFLHHVFDYKSGIDQKLPRIVALIMASLWFVNLIDIIVLNMILTPLICILVSLFVFQGRTV